MSKIYRPLLAVVFASLLSLGLVACADDNGNGDDDVRGGDLEEEVEYGGDDD
jgi:hypothetical protein